MRFLTIDGSAVKGRSYDDVVAALSSLKLVEASSLESYRKSVARRVGNFSRNVEIDTSDNRAFVQSLEKAGFLTRIPTDMSVNDFIEEQDSAETGDSLS